MEPILRSLAIYFFLLVLFRVSGKRSLSQITTFDFVLLLIIAEATQQALVGDDFSVTNGFIIIATLFFTDTMLSLLKRRSLRLDRWMEGVPLILVEDGKPIAIRMEKSRVDEEDILSAARETQGLERMDQIKYAVLERSGGISIIPK